MSKTEYDLKAIMYSSYDTPHKLCNIWGIKLSGNPDYHPIMQADQCVSSNATSLGDPCHALFIFFLVRGEASMRGAQNLTQGSRLVLTEWGTTPARHTLTEKYTNENIYARCQSSEGWLTW